LIKESDCLLNLHDGSGFYSEKWEGPNRNPKRYGQSIIADSDVFVDSKTGEKIFLGKMARSVAEQINRQIKNQRYHFHFNNHRTGENTSLHKEQRKSATFYALFTCGIPAFGIETSKSLPLETKVRHHNYAINAFMDRLGIVPETPGINLDPPALNYLVISINDILPVVVKNRQTLSVKAGDTIMISHIEANYERGLTADIVNYGNISDARKKVKIIGATKVVIRKDYYPCGSIKILVGKNREIVSSGISVAGTPASVPELQSFKTRINGKEHIFRNHGRVKLVKGDAFELVDVITTFEDPSPLVVNFKGYVGNPKKNTGEDRGYVIRTDRDLWKRYSLQKKGKTYQVVVKYFDDVVGKLQIDLKNPVKGP